MNTSSIQLNNIISLDLLLEQIKEELDIEESERNCFNDDIMDIEHSFVNHFDMFKCLERK